jgi:hypothetical protein
MNVVLYVTFIKRKDLAVIIDAQPRFLHRFFRLLRSGLSKPQFSHLWTLILALVVNLRRAKLAHLTEVPPDHGHRTAHGAFLAQADWDAVALLNDQVHRLLRRMKPRPGETIYLLIDDTRIAKRGKTMAGLSEIWDHKQQKYVRGHLVITAAISFRGVVFPWRFVVWKAKPLAGRSYRKTTEIAAEIIRAFDPPKGLKVRVLFDAFYLCPLVTKTCHRRGFSWFSVASKNRTFTRQQGGKRKIAALAPGLLKHKGRRVRMRRSRGWAQMRIAQADGRLARIGDVRMVVSKRPRSAWKTTVAFVTNETNRDGRTIVSIYERRWDIEVLFKELQGDLGLGDYQVLSEDAILKHLHLCGLAHLLLTHHSMEAVGAQARKANVEVPLPTMSERLNALRRAIRRDQVRRLVKGKRHRNLRQKLDKYLLAA